MLMKPYPGYYDVGSLERIFNAALSRCRVVVENSFGILNSVFRIFWLPINLNPQTHVSTGGRLRRLDKHVNVSL